MKNHLKKVSLLAVSFVAAALLLTACSGNNTSAKTGGSGDNSVTTSVSQSSTVDKTLNPENIRAFLENLGYTEDKEHVLPKTPMTYKTEDDTSYSQDTFIFMDSSGNNLYFISKITDVDTYKKGVVLFDNMSISTARSDGDNEKADTLQKTLDAEMPVLDNLVSGQYVLTKDSRATTSDTFDSETIQVVTDLDQVSQAIK